MIALRKRGNTFYIDLLLVDYMPCEARSAQKVNLFTRCSPH